MIKKAAQKNTAENIRAGLPKIKAVQKQKDGKRGKQPEEKILYAHRKSTRAKILPHGAEYIKEDAYRGTAQKGIQENLHLTYAGYCHLPKQARQKAAFPLTAAAVRINKRIHMPLNGNLSGFYRKLIDMETLAAY